jgi:hypothetical protein
MPRLRRWTGRTCKRDGIACHAKVKRRGIGALCTPHSEFRIGNELFSCIHFGMDDWGKWRLNLIVGKMEPTNLAA